MHIAVNSCIGSRTGKRVRENPPSPFIGRAALGKHFSRGECCSHVTRREGVATRSPRRPIRRAVRAGAPRCVLENERAQAPKSYGLNHVVAGSVSWLVMAKRTERKGAECQRNRRRSIPQAVWIARGAGLRVGKALADAIVECIGRSHSGSRACRPLPLLRIPMQRCRGVVFDLGQIVFSVFRVCLWRLQAQADQKATESRSGIHPGPAAKHGRAFLRRPRRRDQSNLRIRVEMRLIAAYSGV